MVRVIEVVSVCPRRVRGQAQLTTSTVAGGAVAGGGIRVVREADQ